MVETIYELSKENEELKFRLSNVNWILIDFCKSVQCYYIQQEKIGIEEGVEDYLESINFK